MISDLILQLEHTQVYIDNIVVQIKGSKWSNENKPELIFEAGLNIKGWGCKK